MLGFKSDKNSKKMSEINLFKDYPRFYEAIYKNIKKATVEFFQRDFELNFMGLSLKDNILLYGDEYFVNKLPVTNKSTIEVRLSAGLVEEFLNCAIGQSEEKFGINTLTDIEAMLIKAYTVHLYKSIEPHINKAETNKKNIKNAINYNLTFYVHVKNEHIGKIIFTVPDYLLSGIKEIPLKTNFGIGDFAKAVVDVDLAVGAAKISLEEIKALENGDIIVLDESDINKMSVLIDGKAIKFKINPNPSLIISIDNSGGDEMEEETSVKSQNMWDSILVDIVAEFNNVKLTLGELKQISEGLVIDIGSVYDNKIKLRVENQVVATGELVILNDRYGVRINEVTKAKEAPKPQASKAAAPAAAPKPAAAPAKPAAAPAQKAPAAGRPAQKKPAAAPAQKPANAKEGDEKFDYSDFEIEDESI